MPVIIAFLLGVGLVATPIVLDILHIHLGTGSQVTMTISGAALILFSGLAFVFTRLYHKTKASEAFVRTGQGGAKVIQDGGAVIIPFIHELVRVSLQTVRIDVKRENAESLITADKLRADVRAEFFVRVAPNADAILQASRSVGDVSDFTSAVRSLIEDKLVSALRSAAATKTLEQLNSERTSFLEEVVNHVAKDLENNGLALETVTISHLDQTDPKFLKTNNIFDAQGSKKIAEITQHSMTERNKMERDGEEARKKQDVENRQRILALEQLEKAAVATQQAEVAQMQATATRDTQTKAIEMARETELAALAKEQALEIAQKERERLLAVAEEAKGQAVLLASEEKKKAVALATERREQETLVAQQQKAAAAAEAQAERAEKQRILSDKEAEVAKAQQAITTIQVTQDAERAKIKSVMEAQAAAERAVIEAKAAAERSTLAARSEAESESFALSTRATARKAAADAEAEATLKKASADADAALKKATAEAEAEKLRAQADQVRAMVPIEVRRAEVEVEKNRVETVIKPELEAREKHGKIAQDFEIAKAQIVAEKEVRIAFANAQATMFSRVEAKLYGTPADVARMMSSFTSGQSLATVGEGFSESLTPEAKQTVVDAAKTVTEVAGKAIAAVAQAASNGKG